MFLCHRADAEGCEARPAVPQHLLAKQHFRHFGPRATQLRHASCDRHHKQQTQKEDSATYSVHDDKTEKQWQRKQ